MGLDSSGCGKKTPHVLDRGAGSKQPRGEGETESRFFWETHLKRQTRLGWIMDEHGTFVKKAGWKVEAKNSLALL